MIKPTRLTTNDDINMIETENVANRQLTLASISPDILPGYAYFCTIGMIDGTIITMVPFSDLKEAKDWFDRVKVEIAIRN